MTGGDFIDIESLDGQDQLIERARRAIDAIGTVEAASSDDVVRVRVTVSGVVVGIDLAEETARLNRVELARLITSTAQRATEIAAAKVAAALAELEQSQMRMVEHFETIDPAGASSLRGITANIRPESPQPPSDDALDFYSPFQRESSGDGDDEW